MRKLIALVALLAVTGGALYLGFMLAVAGRPGACPTALLQGTLVEHEGTLGVESIPGDSIVTVDWPFGYGVAREDGTLILTRVFVTVARVGDRVSMGGGSGRNDTVFQACGPVSLGLMVPPEEPSHTSADPTQAPRALSGPVTLQISGTAYEPCVQPPSGCGYWVILKGDDGVARRARLEHNRSYDSAVTGSATPLTLADGLPSSLPEGSYDMVFQVGEFADDASAVPLEDGTMGYPPALSTACQTHLDIPVGARRVSVDVTYHWSACTVVIER